MVLNLPLVCCLGLSDMSFQAIYGYILVSDWEKHLEMFVNGDNVITEFDVGVYSSRAWCSNSNIPVADVVHPLAYCFVL